MNSDDVITKATQKSFKIEYQKDFNAIAYIEIEDREGKKHTFSDGIHSAGDILIPKPYGCEFYITNIKSRQWGNTKYKITFKSEYSGEVTFYCGKYNTSN